MPHINPNTVARHTTIILADASCGAPVVQTLESARPQISCKIYYGLFQETSSSQCFGFCYQATSLLFLILTEGFTLRLLWILLISIFLPFAIAISAFNVAVSFQPFSTSGLFGKIMQIAQCYPQLTSPPSYPRQKPCSSHCHLAGELIS